MNPKDIIHQAEAIRPMPHRLRPAVHYDPAACQAILESDWWRGLPTAVTAQDPRIDRFGRRESPNLLIWHKPEAEWWLRQTSECYTPIPRPKVKPWRLVGRLLYWAYVAYGIYFLLTYPAQ